MEERGAVADCGFEEGDSFSVEFLENFAVQRFFFFGLDKNIGHVFIVFELYFSIIKYLPFGFIVFLDGENFLFCFGILKSIDLLVLLLNLEVDSFLLFLLLELVSLDLFDSIVDCDVFVVIGVVHIMDVLDEHAEDLCERHIVFDIFAEGTLD